MLDSFKQQSNSVTNFIIEFRSTVSDISYSNRHKLIRSVYACVQNDRSATTVECMVK